LLDIFAILRILAFILKSFFQKNASNSGILNLQVSLKGTKKHQKTIFLSFRRKFSTSSKVFFYFCPFTRSNTAWTYK